jgi:hypothetical protein
VALRTANPSVLASDQDSGRSKVEISKNSFLLVEDSRSFGPIEMIKRMESFVGNGFDPSSIAAHRD